MANKTGWEIGDVILDLYEVREVYTSGGMGLVYRIRHRGWGVDLAMKRPRQEYFQTEEHKTSFETEAETWINLGLHPNIVSCYYVRRVEEIPSVFAEFVSSGSLKDWIKDKQIKSMETVLDVAIQFASGLHYAHSHGLVHQDVKPANAMMTHDGILKVTDFGLAKATSAAKGIPQTGAFHNLTPEESVIVTSGGMTPAYCSPEQANGERLSKKTDIWSWGLSILEIFIGEVKWFNGVVAMSVLEGYLQDGSYYAALPKMPDELVKLLTWCFKLKPKDRPADMLVIIDELKDIYSKIIGKTYPRPEYVAGRATADRLNNSAISLLDLGREKDAKHLWDEALRTDPGHVESTFNLSLFEWKNSKIVEKELFRRIDEALKGQDITTRDYNLLGKLDMFFGHYSRAVEAYRKAGGETSEKSPEDMRDLAVALSSEGSKREGVDKREAAGSMAYWKEVEGYSKKAIESGYKDSQVITVFALSLVRQGAVKDGETFYKKQTEVLKHLPEDLDSAVNRYIPGHEIVRTFDGHNGLVKAVALSNDGKMAVSAGTECMSVRLWEVESANCLKVFTGHSDWVNDVLFLPRERFALSASNDKTIRLWNLHNGKTIRVFYGHNDGITSLALMPNGKYILSGGNDSTVRYWELSTGKLVKTLQGHMTGVCEIAVTPAGIYAVSASLDANICVWNVVTGKLLRKIDTGDSMLQCLCVDQKNRWVFAGGQDMVIHMYEISTGNLVRVFRGLEGSINAIKIMSDGIHMISASADNKICIWEIESGQKVGLFSGHDVAGFALTPDDSYAMLCVWNGLRLINIKNKYMVPYAIAFPVTSVEAETREWKFRSHMDEAKRFMDEGQYKEVPEIVKTARLIKGYERDREALDMFEKVSSYFPKKGLLNAWELQNLKAHDGKAISVTISPDGNSFLSTGTDKMIFLWNMERAQIVKQFKQHNAETRCLRFSIDGKYFFSGTTEGQIYMWGVDSGQIESGFSGHFDGVNSIDVSPDGKFLLSASNDGTARLWDIKTSELLRVYKGHSGEVTHAHFSTDMEFIASSGRDETVRLWLLNEDSHTQSFRMVDNPISSLAISPNLCHLIAGGLYVGNVVLWNIKTGKTIKTMRGHMDGVSTMTMLMDGQFCLSGGKDGTVRIWHVETGRNVRAFNFHSGRINSLTISKDGKVFIAALEDGTLRVWYLDWEPDVRDFVMYDEVIDSYVQTFLKLHTPYLQENLSRRGIPEWSEEDLEEFLSELKYRGHGWITEEGIKDKVIDLTEQKREENIEHTMSFQGRIKRAWDYMKKGKFQEAIDDINTARVLKGYENDERIVEILDRLSWVCERSQLKSAKNIRYFKKHSMKVSVLTFSPDTRYILSASHDGLLNLIKTSTGEVIRTFKGHKGEVYDAVFLPDGKFVLSAGKDRITRLWNTGDGHCIKEFKGHMGAVTALAVTGDGDFFLSASLDKSIKLWELESGFEINTFKITQNHVNSIAISPDGNKFVYGTKEPLIHLLNISTGSRLKTYTGHSDEVISVAFSPKGELFASCSNDRALRVWNVEAGDINAVLEGHDGPVKALCFSPDGRFLFSGSTDETMRMWQLGSSLFFDAFEGQTGNVTVITISGDGRYLLAGNETGSINMWSLEWELSVKEPAPWDDGAFLYAQNFLITNTPHFRNSPERQKLPPSWSNDKFKIFLRELGWRGYGWLRPQGVKDTLVEMQIKATAHAKKYERFYNESIHKGRELFKKGHYKEVVEIVNKMRTVKDIILEPKLDTLLVGLTQVFPKSGLINAWQEKLFEVQGNVFSLAIAKEKDLFFVGSGDGLIRAFNISTGGRARIFKGHKDRITSLSACFGGQMMLSTGADGQLRIWETESGQCLHVFFDENYGSANSVSLEPEERFALVCYEDGTIIMWDIEKRQNITKLSGYTDELVSISLGADGTSAVAGAIDGTICFWSLEKDEPLHIVKGHNGTVMDVKISPDCKSVVTVSQDSTMKVWDLKTFRNRYTCSFHKDSVNGVDISPDSKNIISISSDTTLRIWDISTGENIKTLIGHIKSIDCLSLDTFGRYILTGGLDNTVRLWYLDWQFSHVDVGGWSDNVKTYLKSFLSRYTIKTRDAQGIKPWKGEGFEKLWNELKIRGYGWINPDILQKKLRDLDKQLTKERLPSKSWFSKFFG